MDKEQITAIASLVWLFLSIISSILVQKGYSALPVTEAQTLQTVTIISTIASGMLAWWKNNNITFNAKAAQKVKNALDEGSWTSVTVNRDGDEIGKESSANSESVNPSAEVAAGTAVLVGGANKDTESEDVTAEPSGK